MDTVQYRLLIKSINLLRTNPKEQNAIGIMDNSKHRKEGDVKQSM